MNQRNCRVCTMWAIRVPNGCVVGAVEAMRQLLAGVELGEGSGGVVGGGAASGEEGLCGPDATSLDGHSLPSLTAPHRNSPHPAMTPSLSRMKLMS